MLKIPNSSGRFKRSVEETRAGDFANGLVSRLRRLRVAKHPDEHGNPAQQGNGAGETSRNAPKQGSEGILPANSTASEFFLGGVGGFLRQGNTKPETQVGRSFRRPDGTDQGLRNPPLREFSRTAGAGFKVRGNLLHGCASHCAVKVFGELLA
jgi:hypothetical protein